MTIAFRSYAIYSQGKPSFPYAVNSQKAIRLSERKASATNVAEILIRTSVALTEIAK